MFTITDNNKSDTMDTSSKGLNVVFPIYNQDGTPFHNLVLHKSAYESTVMSLGDKITGDVYYKDNSLSFTMNEYIEYDGVKFCLVNPPTIVREGLVSDNSELKGMTKYSFEFYHPMYMLSNFPFTDVAVSFDENRYKSQDKSFAWIGYIKDFVDKLNKVLETTEWVVVLSDTITEDKLATLSDVLSFDKNTVAEALKTAYETWEVPFIIDKLEEGEYFHTDANNDNVDYYSQGKRFFILFGLPSNEIIHTADGSTFEQRGTTQYNGSFYYLDKAIYLQKGENIVIEEGKTRDGGLGTFHSIVKANVNSVEETINASTIGEILSEDGTYTATEDIFLTTAWRNAVVLCFYKKPHEEVFVFRFGQDLGFKNNSRTARNNKVITRLAGYGSEDNIPYGYPQIPWYGNQKWEYTIDNDSTNPNSYPIYKGIMNGKYVKLIKHPFTRSTLMPSIYEETIFNKISPYAVRDVRPGEKDDGYSQTLEGLLATIQEKKESAPTETEIAAFEELLSAIDYVVNNKANKSFSGTDYSGNVSIQADGDIRGSLETQSFNFEFADIYVASWHTFDLNPNYNPNTEIIDYYDADDEAIYPTLINPVAPSYEIHQFEKVKPELGEAHIVDAFPYDDTSIYSDRYMLKAEFIELLQSYISTIESEAVKVELENIKINAENDVYYPNVSGEVARLGSDGLWQDGGFSFSYESDDYYAYFTFKSLEVNFYRIVLYADAPKSGDEKYFEEFNVPVWNNSINDDGEYVQSYFKITLPILDFDIYACASITQEMKIAMRSGACIGCTFTAQVDWEDYKRNFYNADGEFDPEAHIEAQDGHVRDITKYPDSSQTQVTLIVQKDTDTFGTLMPNIYQQPKGETEEGAGDGDMFVIIGISLPYSYVKRAQERLDGDMKEYLLENNVSYFDYPMKFSEHFLATRLDILSQIRNNTIIRFPFNGENLALYIKSISVKFGDNVLPQYDFTLTDDVEIVLNKIGEVTDDVSRLRVQVSALNSYYSKVFIEELEAKLYKDREDTAQEKITFNKGVKFGSNTSYGVSENGDMVIQSINTPSYEHGFDGRGVCVEEKDGGGFIETDSLIVRKKLSVAELEIMKKQYIGGNISIGSASCIAEKVIEVKSSIYGKGYKIFFKRAIGDDSAENMWKIGDMAKSQTFNMLDTTTAGVSNRYWYRVVTEVGSVTEESGELYNYIVVSNKKDSNQKAVYLDLMRGLTTIGHSWSFDDSVENSIPQAGDIIVQEGSAIYEDRQNLITIDVVGDDAPCIAQYKGIGSVTTTCAEQYNISAHKRTNISPNGNVFYAKHFIVEVSDESVTREYNLNELVAELSVTSDAITQRVSALEYGNLLTGLADGAGWDYVSFNKDTCGFYTDGSQLIESPIYQLEPQAFYCFSCYCDTTQKATVVVTVGDISDTFSFTDVDRTDVYQGKPRRHVVLDECDAVQLVFEGEGTYYKPQIEEVASLDNSPTAFKEGQWKTEGMINVSADNIRLAVNNTGIDINAKKITLTSENTFVDGSLTTKSLQTTPANSGQYTKISGGIAEFYGAMGVANIRVGIDEYGQAVFQFYDNNGTLLYNLGPNGLAYISQVQEAFVENTGFVNYSSDADTSLEQTDWNDVADDVSTVGLISIFQYIARQTKTDGSTVYYAGDYCSDVTTAEQANNRMFEHRNQMITYSNSSWASSLNKPLNGVYLKVEDVAAGEEGIEIEEVGTHTRTWKIVYGAHTDIKVYRYKNGLLKETKAGSNASEHIISRTLIFDSSASGGISNPNI